ncbi:MAG: hypothetical protein ABIK89_18325 [Planctomycetota bacterium]
MSKKDHRKAAKKRKSRRADPRRQQVSLAYHGNKYRTEKLVKVHFRAEAGIYESFVMTDRTLTDRTTTSALEQLIGQMQRGPLPDLEDTSTVDHVEGEDEPLVIWNIRRNWQQLFQTEPCPSRDNLIGVLRTILGSVEVWRTAASKSRSYLRYVEGFLQKLGVSVEAYSPDDEPIGAPGEEDLLLIGRAWCHEDDPEAAAEFRRRVEYMLQSGEAETVVEVCQQLIGESAGTDVVPELFAFSIRAQQSLHASMG